MTSDIKNANALEDLVKNAFQIRESLNLSMQLYATSCLLEVYYAQNMDSDFIKSLEDSITTYIRKCDSRILSSFSMLKQRVSDFKNRFPIQGKLDKQPLEKDIEDMLDLLHSGETGKNQKKIQFALHSAAEKSEYIIDLDGNVYYKAPTNRA